MGIWNLIQLPPGGEMLVPLYSRTTPQKCFGHIPAERMTIEDHLLRVRVDFSGSHKIALKAAAICGRAGYVYGRGDRWSLVIRNFFVNPSGEYIDVQRHDPDDYGYAFQMCRVDEPQYGSFCELEYHAPAIGAFPIRREARILAGLGVPRRARRDRRHRLQTAWARQFRLTERPKKHEPLDAGRDHSERFSGTVVAGAGGVCLQNARRQGYLSRSLLSDAVERLFGFKRLSPPADRRRGGSGRHGGDYP